MENPDLAKNPNYLIWRGKHLKKVRNFKPPSKKNRNPEVMKTTKGVLCDKSCEIHCFSLHTNFSVGLFVNRSPSSPIHSNFEASVFLANVLFAVCLAQSTLTDLEKPPKATVAFLFVDPIKRIVRLRTERKGLCTNLANLLKT